MGKVLFVPSGNSESFFNEGHSATLESPAWVKAKGLDLFEYSFGQGYRMSSDTAVKIGNEFKKEGIELSVHAPYFINFANPDDEMFSKTIGYISTGIKFLKNLQAKRLIFHPASCGKQTREDAVKLMMERFKEVMPSFEKELDDDMFLCPETMGKLMQIGTYKEVIDLCTISSKLIPTFDFGHINSLEQGSLKAKDDFKRILDYSIDKLGYDRTNNCHIHFSKIQYGPKGEIKHLNYDDVLYGPDFEPLAEVLIEYNLSPRVICESMNQMPHDALLMKKIYHKLLDKWVFMW